MRLVISGRKVVKGGKVDVHAGVGRGRKLGSCVLQDPIMSGGVMEIFSVDRDGVVNATVSLGKTNYRYALDSILPLIDRFSEQRDVQNPKFYERLRRDILRRCLIPPITLAFIGYATLQWLYWFRILGG